MTCTCELVNEKLMLSKK